MTRFFLLQATHLRAIALAAAYQARVRPHLRCVAASRRVCTRLLWQRLSLTPALAPPYGNASISCLPFCGSGASDMCLPFSGSALSLRSIGISRGAISFLHTALSFPQGADASSLAAVTLSASPAGSTAAILFGQGKCSACDRRQFHSYVSTFGASTSTFSTMATLPLLPSSLRRAASGRWSSVVRHSVAVLSSRDGFLCAGISNGDGSRDRVKKLKCW